MLFLGICPAGLPAGVSRAAASRLLASPARLPASTRRLQSPLPVNLLCYLIRDCGSSAKSYAIKDFYTEEPLTWVISTFINVRRVGLFCRGDVICFVNTVVSIEKAVIRIRDILRRIRILGFVHQPSKLTSLHEVTKQLKSRFFVIYFACWLKDPDPNPGGQKTHGSGYGKLREKIWLWALGTENACNVSENKSELT
jgi:hypothetical protein